MRRQADLCQTCDNRPKCPHRQGMAGVYFCALYSGPPVEGSQGDEPDRPTTGRARGRKRKG